LVLSRVIWIWDSLGLELGELALVAGCHRWSVMAALVATWYGATPVLLLDASSGEAPEGVTPVPLTGSDEQARELAAMFAHKPGIAALDLGGAARTVDLLLEALPPSSRLMLAGAAREPLTIDFYANVHRKGLRLLSGIADAEREDAVRAARVERLLTRPAGAAWRAALLAVARDPS
jgi:hypothetical protein